MANPISISESFWESFLKTIELEYGKETVDRWVRSLKVSSSHDTLTLLAKDSFQILWIEEHLLHKITDYLSSKEIHMRVCLSLEGEVQSAAKKRQKTVKKKGSSFQLHFSELDPTATYESFIKHVENEIPLKILEEICSTIIQRKLQALSTLHNATSTDDILPNPIYLYGPSGCGKTHLLQAMAHTLRRAGINALYARADLFTEHVIKSIRASEMAHFRQLWRNVDVLLLDDVHLFAKKSATQEELFHTFNTLHVANKPIFLSANRMTQQLQHIEPRLISRFDWGIALSLSCLPKRMYKMLIEQKAQALNFPLSPKSADYLVSLFPSSPKACAQALEATILRTTLSSHYTQKSVETLSENKLRSLLKDLIEEEEKTALTFEKIIATAAHAYGILESDLLGKSQSREAVIPRQVAMYLIRKHLKWPYMKIGDRFFRDHSTVMSGIRQIEKCIKESSPDICNTLSSIELALST